MPAGQSVKDSDTTVRELRTFTFPGRSKMDLAAEKLFEISLKICGVSVMALLLLIFFFIAKEGAGAFGKVGDFSRYWGHWDVDWNNKKVFMYTWQTTGDLPKLSVAPLVCGTLLVALPAALLAGVIGTGAGVFLSELSPRPLREILKPALEMLASIPSVVIGFFCLVVLASILWGWIEPYQNQLIDAVGNGKIDETRMWLGQKWFYEATRLNAIIGAMGVTIVILPLVASLSEEALRAVPQDIRHASYALGATKWQTILFVTLPAAIRGVGRAWLLGLGRGMGETMIAVMAIGNAAVVTLNPFVSVRTMTATIAAELGAVDQGGLVYHSLFLVGCLLFILTFLVNLGAQTMLHRGGGARR